MNINRREFLFWSAAAAARALLPDSAYARELNHNELGAVDDLAREVLADFNELGEHAFVITPDRRIVRVESSKAHLIPLVEEYRQSGRLDSVLERHVSAMFRAQHGFLEEEQRDFLVRVVNDGVVREDIRYVVADMMETYTDAHAELQPARHEVEGIAAHVHPLVYVRQSNGRTISDTLSEADKINGVRYAFGYFDGKLTVASVDDEENDTFRMYAISDQSLVDQLDAASAKIFCRLECIMRVPPMSRLEGHIAVLNNIENPSPSQTALANGWREWPGLSLATYPLERLIARAQTEQAVAPLCVDIYDSCERKAAALIPFIAYLQEAHGLSENDARYFVEKIRRILTYRSRIASLRQQPQVAQAEQQVENSPPQNNQPPTTNHEPQTTSDQQPTTNYQPPTNDQLQTTNYQPPAPNPELQTPNHESGARSLDLRADSTTAATAPNPQPPTPSPPEAVVQEEQDNGINPFLSFFAGAGTMAFLLAAGKLVKSFFGKRNIPAGNANAAPAAEVVEEPC